MKTVMSIIDAVQYLANLHAYGANVKSIDGAVSVFSAQDQWVDDEDIWPWQLAVDSMDSSPYYWGANA